MDHIFGNHISHSESETTQIAQNLAKTLRGSEIIALHGDLGAGKSVFARSSIRFLCHNNILEVPSPTYTLVQSYDAHIQDTPLMIHHFDLYRLENPEEIYDLGWEEMAGHGICLIEWPQRLGGLMPDNALNITLSPDTHDPSTRKISIKANK